MAEEQKFSAEFGGKTAHVIFSKSGSNYNVRTWGLKYRDIEKYLDQYRQWLTQCVEEFGEEIGERLFLKTYHYTSGLKHTLEPLSADLARETDINPAKTKVILDASKLTPEHLEEIKRLGGSIRPVTKAEEELSPEEGAPLSKGGAPYCMVANPIVRTPENEAAYVALFNLIGENGVQEKWGRYKYKYFYPGDGWKYWTMTTDVRQSRVLNRARHTTEQQPQK